MLRFAIHLLIYGMLALFVGGIGVAALVVWWRTRGTATGKRAGFLALGVVGVVVLLLGAKLAPSLVRSMRTDRRLPAHVSTPRPATLEPDADAYSATPRPNHPNPPPRHPAPPHKPSPPHPIKPPHAS